MADYQKVSVDKLTILLQIDYFPFIFDERRRN